MINPSLNKLELFFSSEFFPENLVKPFNDWLFHTNQPFKDISSNFIETIQNVSVPGFDIPSQEISNIVNGKFNINNDHPPTTKFFTESNEPWFNSIENSTITMTFRNNIINWMYLKMMLYNRYKRVNRVNRFFIILTMMDSAEIPMIQFRFSDCWVSNLPNLEFSMNSSFNESKTFDAQFKFNDFDVEFIIPEFNKIDLNL